MKVTYEQTCQTFERAVIQMQNNIQYLADEGKVSDKFLTMQNLVLKALIDYQQQTESLLSQLDWDIAELTIGKIKEYNHLLDVKEKLEAVCLIHGIIDFPMWMNMSKQYLISEVVEQNEKNGFYMSYRMKEYIYEVLSDEEREAFDKMFQKKRIQEIEEIENQIIELQKRIREKKNGVRA